jgi:plasmid maintenance system killer protein
MYKTFRIEFFVAIRSRKIFFKRQKQSELMMIRELQLTKLFQHLPSLECSFSIIQPKENLFFYPAINRQYHIVMKYDMCRA